MKKGIKKTAIFLIFSFSCVFVFTPTYAFANHRDDSFIFNNRGDNGVTDRFGRGGRWVQKDESASDALWPIITGIAIIGILAWLFTKGPSLNQNPQQQIVYTPKYPSANQQQQGAPGKSYYCLNCDNSADYNIQKKNNSRLAPASETIIQDQNNPDENSAFLPPF